MTISRFATAGVLGLALTGTALAADLPMRSAPPPFVPPPPVFTWTGFYAGVNAGYVFDGSTRFRSNDAVIVAPQTNARVNDDGFTAGGQIGYNYQFGAGNGIVVGFEADAQYTALDKPVGVQILSRREGATQTLILPDGRVLPGDRVDLASDREGSLLFLATPPGLPSAAPATVTTARWSSRARCAAASATPSTSSWSTARVVSPTAM